MRISAYLCFSFLYSFTIVTSRPGKTRHVTVTCVAIPLLHACSMIGTEIMSALLARMYVGVNVASGCDQRTRHDGIGNEIGTFPAEIQRRQTPLKSVTAENLFW